MLAILHSAAESAAPVMLVDTVVSLFDALSVSKIGFISQRPPATT